MTGGRDERDPLAPISPSHIPQIPTLGRSWGAFALLLVFAFGFLLFFIYWTISLL